MEEILRNNRYFKMGRDKKGRFTSNIPDYRNYEIFAHVSEKTKKGTSVKHDLTVKDVKTNLSEGELRRKSEKQLIDFFKEEVAKSDSKIGKWKFNRKTNKFQFDRDNIYISVEGIDKAKTENLKDLGFTALMKQINTGNEIKRIEGSFNLKE